MESDSHLNPDLLVSVAKSASKQIISLTFVTLDSLEPQNISECLIVERPLLLDI